MHGGMERGIRVVGLVAAMAVVGGMASRDAFAQAPAQGENLQTQNACYVRLPDLPDARYGGFGAYNAETGVLTYAGGGEKLSEENTEAHEELYAIKLDGSAKSWTKIPYSSRVGYTSDADDKGCREMASVQISPQRHLSVFGKDGCDNGSFDTSSKKGGDIKELQIGSDASRSSVRWRTNSGANRLPPDLAAEKGKLHRLMATWDSKRNRLIFGQGTFDDAFDRESQDEIYYATAAGSKWSISEFRPAGAVPSRRLGTCAQYVNIENEADPAKNVDGVVVLGGKTGGDAGPQRKEVWWFDLSKNANAGEWTNISERFSNLVDLGARREGACAYDTETHMFYSVMGRADSAVPDGDKRSAGFWRTDLSQLGDPDASLSWERLAKDKQDATVIRGRRLIPNVWDEVNKRFFVIGGRNDLDELADVWALYPGVTGDACATLDPYAPFSGPTAPEPTTAPPSATPVPGTPAPPATATPRTPVAPANPNAEACPGLEAKVPTVVIALALASPDRVAGWGELCNPGVPASQWNHTRRQLSLRNPGTPYNPLFNSVVYQCGCN